MTRARRFLDPYERAVELVRAISNKDRRRFRRLWRLTVRRRATAMALADLADSWIRINAKQREQRPGALLNQLRMELRREQVTRR